MLSQEQVDFLNNMCPGTHGVLLGDRVLKLQAETPQDALSADEERILNGICPAFKGAQLGTTMNALIAGTPAVTFTAEQIAQLNSLCPAGGKLVQLGTVLNEIASA